MKTYFTRLPLQKQYDMAAAVRGPDEGDESLTRIKSVLTARVRSIMFGNDELDGSGAAHYGKAMDEKEMTRLRAAVTAARLADKGYHFLMHLRDAVWATVGHPLWGGKGKEIYLLLGGYINDAGKGVM